MNVLLLRAGALGDVLLLRRAVSLLRENGHRVGLLAPESAAAPLVGKGPGQADVLIPWDRADVARVLGGDWHDDDGLCSQIAFFHFAVAYTRSASIVSTLAAHIQRVVRHDPSPPPREHASRWLLRPLEPVCGQAAGEPPVLMGQSGDEAALAPLLARLPPAFLAIHPGSGSAAKNWPADRFAAIAREEGRFLLVQGPADGDAARPLRNLPGAVPACDLPARVIGALLARARLYVGNDSGVSHLAAAFGAPTLALFGPTDPDVWSPVGPHVRVVRSPSARMDDLALETVRAAMS